MSGRIARIVGALIASTCLAGGALTVYADMPVQGIGAFTISFVPSNFRVADGNTFFDYAFTEISTGIVDGTRIGSGDAVIHPDGTLNTQNTGVFTGTIAGKTGTAEMAYRGSGTFASASGTYTIRNGTGGLAGVHAVGSDSGSTTGPTSFAGTESFTVNFSAP